MKAYGVGVVYILIFLTLALAGGEWSSRPGRFTPWERAPGTHWIGGRVNPRAVLEDVEKRKFLTLPRLELRPLGRPVRGQSLYRLHYPGSYFLKIEMLNTIFWYSFIDFTIKNIIMA
jgi:hypothetical protein